MGKYGYLIKREGDEEELFAKYQALNDFGCKQVIISQQDVTSADDIAEIFPLMQNGDELIFYSTTNIRKTALELFEFLIQIKKKNISVTFLKEKISSNKNIDKPFADILDIVLTMELNYIKTSKQTKTKNCHKEIGRPTIDKDKMHQIIFCYEKKNMSYREISRVTNLSLGTVHKYINLHKEQKNHKEKGVLENKKT